MIKNFFIVLLLLVGIGVSVSLANNPQVFFSQAAFKPIDILQQGCVKLQNGRLVSTCDNIDLKLSYLWEASPTATPSTTCSCSGAEYPNTPITTNECNRVVCGTDRQNYKCTPTGFVAQGGVCGATATPSASVAPTPTPNPDLDGDGVPNEQDCEPTDKTKWQIKKLFRDEDMDKFTSGGVQDVCIGSSTPDGWRDYDSTTTAVILRNYQNEYLNQNYGTNLQLDYTVTAADCYDKNRLVFPRPVFLAEAGYYAKNRGDGSFDYNCDGQETSRVEGGSQPTYYYGSGADNYATTVWLPSSDPLNQISQQTSTRQCGGGQCPVVACGVSTTYGLIMCR